MGPLALHPFHSEKIFNEPMKNYCSFWVLYKEVISCLHHYIQANMSRSVTHLDLFVMGAEDKTTTMQWFNFCLL